MHAVGAFTAVAQGTAFTYQGQFHDNGAPASGNYDMQFYLRDAAMAGNPVGTTNTLSVTLSDGVFTVTLDFGAGIFNGAGRWLEIATRTNGAAAYTVLAPRQKIAPSPYAITANTLTDAGNILNGTVADGRLSANITRLNSLQSFTAAQTFNANLSLALGADLVLGSGSQIRGGLGTALEPSFAFDPSTGFYRPALNNVALSLAGVERLRVNATGSVGLGTNDPSLAKLVVSGHTANNTAVFGDTHPVILQQSFPIVGFNCYYSGSGGITRIHTAGVGGTNFAGLIGLNPYSGNIFFETSSGTTNRDSNLTRSERMTIQQNGNVGIGTAAPLGRLDINSGVGVLEFRNDGDFAPGLTIRGAVNPGVLRFRNRFEAWPNDARTEGGRVDARDTNGTPTVILNGTTGEATCKVLTITGGADIAEPFQVSRDATLPKGAVVVIDDENAGRLKMSELAYDTRVAGIISGANGINPGLALHQQGVIEGGQNVALSGRVYVLADASASPIKPGDLLTTGSLAGHAMAVRDSARAQGAVLGKAMTGLDEGQGYVLVLVTLQ